MFDNLLKILILLSPLICINNASSMILITDIPVKNSFGINGDDIALKNLTIFEMPEAKGDKIATLNQTGYMKIELDEFSLQYIKDSAKAQKPVLEIGAAYGLVTSKVLEKGAVAIANDIDPKHLSILYRNTPSIYLNRLYLNTARFPQKTSFPNNSLSGILLSRVAHFMSGAEIEEALDKIYNWLEPGGKLYFVTLSPYHVLLKKDFLPIYNKRLEQGDKWPGIISNMREYNPREKEEIPDFLHVFEEKIIIRCLNEKGFKIEKMHLFDYSNNSSKGMGYLGFIASRPS